MRRRLGPEHEAPDSQPCWAEGAGAPSLHTSYPSPGWARRRAMGAGIKARDVELGWQMPAVMHLAGEIGSGAGTVHRLREVSSCPGASPEPPFTLPWASACFSLLETCRPLSPLLWAWALPGLGCQPWPAVRGVAVGVLPRFPS